jgi:lipopolysaccharide/colanic/teichoic acid biosynthesis glycosyltransferase
MGINVRKIKISKICIVLVFLALIFFLEPSLRSKSIFAVTFFNSPEVNYEQKETQSLIQPLSKPPEQQKSHAPEPATMILFLGGIGGMVIRFVRKTFEEIKRYMDILLSIFGLAITTPLLLVGAILIKLTSPGSVIYRQRRVGKDGKIFQIFKLRTMSVDAEKVTGAVWAKKNDTRVTFIGRFLRISRIDEIPQLINVLQGDMSIIGPRPERPEIVRELKVKITDYGKRLTVKPGITGLAQIFHKYDETIADVKKKVKYDILYIKKMCLLTDLRILAQTCVVVLTGKGAN